MPTNTPRFNLDDYDPGETGWDHSDLVNFVDEHAVATDTIANRPSSGDYDDQLFYATDQNILWGWDDSANDWTIRGGKGSSSQPLDAVYADVLYNNSETRRIVRVDGTEYVAESPTGEIGRYDSGTDAIQAAHNDLPSDGGLIKLRAGRYDITDPTASNIEFDITKPNVTVLGEGASSRIYLPDNTTETDKGKLIINVTGSGCTLENFVIDGNQQNQGNIGDAEDGHNIKVVGDDFTMRGVRSINSTGDGVELETESAPATKNATITNCQFKNNQEQDIHFHGVHNVTLSNFVATGVHDDGSISFWTDVVNNENIEISNGVIIVDPSAGMQGIRMDVQDGSGLKNKEIRLSDLYIKNGTRGIDIVGTSADGVYMKDVTVDKSRNEAGIRIRGGNHIEMKDVTVKRSQNTGILMSDFDGPLTNVWLEGVIVEDSNRGNNSEDGLALDKSGGHELDNIFIRDCDIYCDSSPLQRRGIRFGENDASTTVGEVHCTGNWVKGVDFEKIRQLYPVVRFDNENMQDALGIEPTTKWVGMEVRSDGSSWDPDTGGGGDGTAEDVRWDGSSWQEVLDYGKTLDRRN